MRRLTLFILLILCTNAFALQKNIASQKWVVFAFDVTDNTAVTGDAAQITANLRIDGGAANGVDDTNPTELEDGYYVFDLSQAETNGDYILICPASSTGDVQVIGCPMATWTTPPYFPTMSIDSNGRIDMIKIAGTTQTANDNGADINAILTDTAEIGAAGAGLTAVPWNAAWDAEVESEVDDSIGGGTGTALSAIPWNAAWDAEVESEVEDAVGADVTAALGDTNELQGDWTDGGRLDLIIDAILVDTSTTLDDYIDTEVAAILADTGTDGVIVASINTDAVSADALNTDAVTEIWAKAMSDLAAGAPSATASVLTAINYLYEAWRNKTITNGTNSEIEIYKDDGSTKLVESDISDDGTDFTRGEMGAPD